MYRKYVKFGNDGTTNGKKPVKDKHYNIEILLMSKDLNRKVIELMEEVGRAYDYVELYGMDLKESMDLIADLSAVTEVVIVNGKIIIKATDDSIRYLKDKNIKFRRAR